MKKYLIVMIIGFYSSTVAASDLIFPVKDLEVAAYPGEVSIKLDRKHSGSGDVVYYSIKCQINNPNKDAVLMQYTCNRSSCGGQFLNDKPINSMLTLEPGVSNFHVERISISIYVPFTQITFKNYDKNFGVTIKSCTQKEIPRSEF